MDKLKYKRLQKMEEFATGTLLINKTGVKPL